MGNTKQNWTAEEEEALHAGVAKHGAGKWKIIQRDPELRSFLYARTNIDLKDKWRNLSVANSQGSRNKSKTPKAKGNLADLPTSPMPFALTSTSVTPSSQDAPTMLDSSRSLHEGNNTAKLLRNVKDLDSIRNPEKCMDEAKKIVDGGANPLESNHSTSAESVSISDAIAVKGKYLPQDLGLAHKRAPLVQRQPLENAVDNDSIDEFFDAYERLESDDTSFSSEETVDKVMLSAPKDISQEIPINPDGDVEEFELAGSMKKTETKVSNILQDPEDLEGDGGLNLLQDKLKIKPRMPDFGRTMSERLEKSGRSSLVIDNVIKNLSKPSIEHKQDMNPESSPTPPTSPFDSDMDAQEVMRNTDALPMQSVDENANADSMLNEEPNNENVLNPPVFEEETKSLGSSVSEEEARDDMSQTDPEPSRRKRVAGGKRIIKAHPLTKNVADAGTSFEDGVRKSKRIKMRPLAFWKGERFVYGRVDDSVHLLGVKCISPGKKDNLNYDRNLKVKRYGLVRSSTFKVELELRALY